MLFGFKFEQRQISLEGPIDKVVGDIKQVVLHQLDGHRVAHINHPLS
jgi:hypothetical protein